MHNHLFFSFHFFSVFGWQYQRSYFFFIGTKLRQKCGFLKREYSGLNIPLLFFNRQISGGKLDFFSHFWTLILVW
jgi:hypothetical protein